MVYLLDVNVLIALLDTGHVQHEAAHAWFSQVGHAAWATCPLTENGVLRIIGNPRYPNTLEMPAAVAPLVAQLGHDAMLQSGGSHPTCTWFHRYTSMVPWAHAYGAQVHVYGATCATALLAEPALSAFLSRRSLRWASTRFTTSSRDCTCSGAARPKRLLFMARKRASGRM